MTVGEGWFRTLIEAAPDVYFRYDFVPVRRFGYVSPAIKTATGYAPDDFCRDPAFCIGLVVREDRRLLRQIVRARRGLTMQLRVTARDGAVVTFDRVMLTKANRG